LANFLSSSMSMAASFNLRGGEEERCTVMFSDRIRS
jgi:hypothetical protein